MGYNDDNRAAELAEADRLRAEITSLQMQIASEKARQVALTRELNIAITGLVATNASAIAMSPKVDMKLSHIEDSFNEINNDVSDLLYIINDVSNNYFTYKNLSMATKKLTELNDKRYTKYKFFDYLRKITIGNVISADKNIISNETITKKVEDIYLKTNDYWLSYANMSITQWLNDNKEAAMRSLGRSIQLNNASSILFYLIINLRFSRIEVAKKWYKLYLNHVDINNINNDFKYILQLFLYGVFGVDKEFSYEVRICLEEILERTMQLHPDFNEKIKKRTLDYLNLCIHNTTKDYAYLRRYSSEYSIVINLLTLAEKNEYFITKIRTLFEQENIIKENLYSKLEEILFNLISEYENKELETYKETKYNEMIIKANGDIKKALELYKFEFQDVSTNKTLDKLLVDYAFNDDIKGVDVVVKRFSLMALKKWIIEAFKEYGDNYRKDYKNSFVIKIDGWHKECDDKDKDSLISDLKLFYDKHKLLAIFRDKYVLGFLLVILGCITILIIMIFEFNLIILIAAIVVFLIFAFCIWRRVVKVLNNYEDKTEQGINKLTNCLNEIKDFKEAYIIADNKNTDLINVFDSLSL